MNQGHQDTMAELTLHYINAISLRAISLVRLSQVRMALINSYAISYYLIYNECLRAILRKRDYIFFK